MWSGVKIIRCAAAAAFLLAATVQCAQAQTAYDAGGECERAVAAEQRLCEGETAPHDTVAVILQTLGRPAQSGEARLPLTRIREDLGYLQTVTDYLSRAASEDGNLDLEAIARSASEIRKRAGRLKDGLALPGAEGGAGRLEEAAPADAMQLREALYSLSARISDAVDNPALRGHLLDATGSVKARSELEKIVLLSSRIKAWSEKLGKTER